MKKKTHIQTQRDAQAIARNVVLVMTEISEQEYFEFQHICGLKFLDHMCQGFQAAYEIFKGNKIFWNWWKIQWAYRDEDFAQPAMFDIHVKIRPNIWRQYHNVALLVCPDTEGGKLIISSFSHLVNIIVQDKIKGN